MFMLVFLLIYQITFIIQKNVKTIDIANSKIVVRFLYLNTESVRKSHNFRIRSEVILIFVSPLNAKNVTIKLIYVTKHILIFIDKKFQKKLFIIMIVFMLSQHNEF